MRAVKVGCSGDAKAFDFRAVVVREARGDAVRTRPLLSCLETQVQTISPSSPFPKHFRRLFADPLRQEKEIWKCVVNGRCAVATALHQGHWREVGFAFVAQAQGVYPVPDFGRQLANRISYFAWSLTRHQPVTLWFIISNPGGAWESVSGWETDKGLKQGISH